MAISSPRDGERRPILTVGKILDVDESVESRSTRAGIESLQQFALLVELFAVAIKVVCIRW